MPAAADYNSRWVDGQARPSRGNRQARCRQDEWLTREAALVTGSRIGQAEEYRRIGRIDGNGERTACAAPGITPIGTQAEPTEEYGCRDLGIIQDYRRQFLEADFSRSTHDLALALRFYQLRREFATNSAASAKLDQIFLNIAAGQVKLAHQQLDQLARQASP